MRYNISILVDFYASFKALMKQSLDINVSLLTRQQKILSKDPPMIIVSAIINEPGSA